jgi:hypothetical protein
MLVTDLNIFLISSLTVILPKNENDRSEDPYSE